MGFYTREELEKIGFKSLGENVLISDKVSIYSPKNISIGNNVRIDDFCVLSAGDGYINIGNYIHIAIFTAIFGAGGVEIEDFSTTSSRVIIYSVTDDYSGETLTNPIIPEKYKKLTYKEVKIKKHSILGTGSIILPGVNLGEGTSIGANSLVLKSTEPWGIYVGSPVRRIKDRKKDLLKLEIEFLKEQGEKL
jgi:acetyltransferase-like isoleucine patch superfamily enzyme